MKTWPWKNNQKFTKAWRQSLRNNPTDAEAELWEKLRRHRFHGYHWRRQVSIDTYVVDFYCALAKLAIELDGSIHNRPDVHAHDVARTQRLNELGIRVLRFTNEQILNDWYRAKRHPANQGREDIATRCRVGNRGCPPLSLFRVAREG